MPSLLLIACSARKRTQPPEPIPALERYDGPFFRVLRKWLRGKTAPSPDILIISAKFGLIAADTPIPDYDQRMTEQRANQLAPQVKPRLQQLLTEQRNERVFVNLGKEYLATVATLSELQSATWATGSIGRRAQQMKKWLEAVPVDGKEIWEKTT